MRLFLVLLLCTAIFHISSFGQTSGIKKTLVWTQTREKVFLFAFSPDGNYVVLTKQFNWNLIDLDSNSDSVGEIDVIETTTGKTLSTLKVCDGKFGLSLRFVSFNNLLAVSCRKGTAEIWDIKDGELIQTINPTVAREVDNYTLSPDGKKIITFENDSFRTSPKAVLSDVESGKLIRILTPKLGGNFATNATFSRDGKMVSVSYDGFVYLWNTSNGELIYKLVDESLKGFPTRSHFSNSLVYIMLFTPDGNKLITTSTDRFAKIWNTKTGELELVLGSHKSRIDIATLSDDGKILAIIGDDKYIEFWEIETGRLLQKFKAKSNPYIEFTLSPDKSLFFSPTEKGASIWDVNTGQEIWNEKTNRAALSKSWKWYLSYDKKRKKLEMFEMVIKQ